jgi:arylsulfatase
MEFAYDGGGLGKGGTASLYIDGNKTGEGRVDRTQPIVFSLDDKTDVGSDRCTPVSDDYDAADSYFNGRIIWVQIDIGEDAKDADHLITPDERYRIALALQ